MANGSRALIRTKIAVLLAVLCAVAVPALVLADYLRGSRAYPANQDGACRVHNYSASQYVAYSYLFGRDTAERRLSHIVSHQPIVTAYRLEGNASNLVFTFRAGVWPGLENNWMLYSLSPVFTPTFFLFIVYPLPIAAIMLMRRSERTGQRTLLPGLLVIALAPAATVVMVRFGFCESPLVALYAGAVIAVAVGAVSMIRPNARVMATVTILFQAATVILLLFSPL